jgi:hypothetical protein
MPLSCAKQSLIGARAKRIEQTRRRKTMDRLLKGASRDRCKILFPILHLEGKVHFSEHTNSLFLHEENICYHVDLLGLGKSLFSQMVTGVLS